MSNHLPPFIRAATAALNDELTMVLSQEALNALSLTEPQIAVLCGQIDRCTLALRKARKRAV